MRLPVGFRHANRHHYRSGDVGVCIKHYSNENGLRFVAKTKLSSDGEPKEILNSNMGDPLPVIARIGRLLNDDLKQGTMQATTRPNKCTPK